MSNKIMLINLKFGDYYKKSKEIYESDWALFVNRIDLLVEAVKEFEGLEIESNMIYRAFTVQFDEEMKKLDMQVESLKSRGML